MQYQELIDSGCPKVVVQFTKGETLEKDQYAYGYTGGMPATNLVGYLTKLQTDVYFRTFDPAPDGFFLVFWYEDKFHAFLDPKVPQDALVGTLELAKQVIVATKLQSTVQANRCGLVDRTGRPLK